MIISETLRKAYIQQRKKRYDSTTLIFGYEEEPDNIILYTPNIERLANREYVQCAVKAGPYSNISSKIDSKYYISGPEYTFTHQVCKNIILGSYSVADFSAPFSGFVKLGEGAIFECSPTGYNPRVSDHRENVLAITSQIQVIGGDWCSVYIHPNTSPVKTKKVLVKGGTFIFDYYIHTLWEFKARAIIGDLDIQIGDDHYVIKENTSCKICQQRSKKNYADYVKSLKDTEVKVGCTVA